MKKLILTLLVALPMSVFAQKFAHFNSGDVIQAMPEYTAAIAEIQKTEKDYTDELKRMQDELRTKIDEYSKNEATMVEAVKTRRQTEIQDLNKRFEEYYRLSQEEIEKLRNTKMNEISEKVGKAVKEIGDAGGYVYIMDLTQGIPYISTTLSTDITAQIKAKLGLK